MCHMANSPGQAEPASWLGGHTMGKFCLHVYTLFEDDLAVREKFFIESVTGTKRIHD